MYPYPVCSFSRSNHVLLKNVSNTLRLGWWIGNSAELNERFVRFTGETEIVVLGSSTCSLLRVGVGVRVIILAHPCVTRANLKHRPCLLIHVLLVVTVFFAVVILAALVVIELHTLMRSGHG